MVNIMDTVSNINGSPKTRHKTVGWLLVGGLLFLRLPFSAGIRYFSQPEWVSTVYQIGTYLLTACLIWWERKRLRDFHIDRLALIIIVLFKPIQTLILAWWGLKDHALAFPRPLSLSLWGIAIGLTVILWHNRSDLPKFHKTSLSWFGIGTVVGIATAIILGFPMSLQIDPGQLTRKPEILPTLIYAIPSFPYQLGYAAVSEEPLFRGFLWGYLRQSKWKDRWICLFQTGLFTLYHIYYLNTAPISFWITVPIAALIMGVLAWRTRSISASMAAHGAMNTLAYAIGYIFAYYFR